MKNVIDDRVMVRAELVRMKQDREAHEEAAKALDLETARVIRKAREVGVSQTEAADLAGVARPTSYKLDARLVAHEKAEAEKAAAAA